MRDRILELRKNGSVAFMIGVAPWHTYFSSLEDSDDDENAFPLVLGFGWNVANVGGAIMGDAGGTFVPAADADGITLPMDARGSAYLPDKGVPFFLDDMPRVGGGAINAASGSFDVAESAGPGVAGGASEALGMIGGGASGLATSAGSSPGKIQRFSFSS